MGEFASAGAGPRYRKLVDYWRARLGGRVQKISLHAGLTCPNRDGTLGFGGCAYCSNEAFVPDYCHAGDSLADQIEAGLAFAARRYPRAVGFLGYLQAYTNTHGPWERLTAAYETVLSHPRLCGLVIGTRPDCLPDPLLDWLAAAARRKPVYLEVGIESFDDATLRRMNRGHGFAAAEDALARLAARGLPAGGHFLVGFPGEPWTRFFDEAERLNALPLHSVKVHQLQIFKGTPLADLYQKNPAAFDFPPADAYLDRLADWLPRVRPDLYIDRLFGEAPARHLAHARWNLRLDALVRAFEELLERRGVRQGAAVPAGALS